MPVGCWGLDETWLKLNPNKKLPFVHQGSKFSPVLPVEGEALHHRKQIYILEIVLDSQLPLWRQWPCLALVNRPVTLANNCIRSLFWILIVSADSF